MNNFKKNIYRVVNINYEPTWTPSGEYCITQEVTPENTGYKGYSTLLKVTNDGNNSPLDINNTLCSESGLPQATKSNTIGDPDYIAPVYDIVTCPLPVLTNKVTSLTAASYLDVNYFINLNLTLQYSVLVNTIFNIEIGTGGGVFTSSVYISAGNNAGSNNIDTGSTNDPSPVNNSCITSSDNSDIDISMFVCL